MEQNGTEQTKAAASKSTASASDGTATDPSPPGKPDLHDPVKRQEVERDLTGLPELLSVRVVPGYERDVDEIHVLTTLQRTPKQTVRDVQSMLLARWGITTDHRVISVVQLDEPGELIPGKRPRVSIARVTISHAGMSIDVDVALSDGDDELTGTAQGPSSPSGRRRTVAKATLEAVESLFGEGLWVELEGVDVAPVLGRRVSIALVLLHSARGDRTVSGSAVVRDEEADAIARSVLDAVNRAL